MFIRTALFLVIAVSLSAVLSHCGQDVCVAGIGSCDNLNKKYQQQGPQNPQYTITVAMDHASVAIGGKATFTAAGGTPPYLWSIIAPVGGNNGTITNDGNNGIYIGPNALPQFASTYAVTVRVTDAKNVVADHPITITLQ